MLERMLEEYRALELLCLGFVIGCAIGLCAGIFASIGYTAEPVYMALVVASAFLCFLFSLGGYVPLSIGLAPGLGIGLLIEMFAVETSTFVPDIGIVIGVTGLVGMMGGWGLRSLFWKENTEKSA